MKIKILHPHHENCNAVRNVTSGDWSTPWAYLEEIYRLDNAGRRIGKRRATGVRWWTIQCNSMDCPGKIAVRERDILEALPKDNIELEEHVGQISSIREIP